MSGHGALGTGHWRAISACLLAALVASASAQTSRSLRTGQWKATFSGPKAQQPKTFGSVLFDFQVDGGVISGTATMGDWPGVCQISEGKLDGDHFSFVTTGELWSSSGYPRYTFDGTVRDGVMRVTLTFGYVGNPTPGRQLVMEGRPVPAPSRPGDHREATSAASAPSVTMSEGVGAPAQLKKG